jgi:murein DD-endopeptidase MepM/ murein hydrolase activator NlpD
MINFGNFHFHQVIDLPPKYEVFDFTTGYDPNRTLESPYGIGRYNEKRKGMYEAAIFSGVRNIHVGIDIAAPVDTAVHAFYEGEYFLLGNNPSPGDYGYTIITKHLLDGIELYALHGHLAKKSIAEKKSGQKIEKGEVIAWLGDKQENGGWNPHLHFQLSYIKPEKCDLPGAVSEEQLENALRIYPDPRLVLGALY